MLDYRLVQAFAAVLEERGFERAAARLCVTQSAVSQRVRQLEDELGCVLIVREAPPRATAAGEALLRHFLQVARMEEETMAALGDRGKEDFRQLSIAANPDSLAVWLMDAVTPFLRKSRVAFEILVEGQERTLGFLKSGAVAGCVSPQGKTIQGCVSTRIGSLRYVLAASPAFAERWFPGGFDRESAGRAPVIHSDRDDTLQYEALARAFGEPRVSPPAHYVPSTEKYFEAVAAGLGYGLISLVQAAAALEEGALVELEPRARVDVTLYWHRWNRDSALMEGLTEAILAEGGRILGAACAE
jgi:LysR family transcriptional regulator, chromosome initiation inhibitor